MSKSIDKDIEKIIEKVKKLLSLANNNSNVYEAEKAAESAEKLLRKYNLDHSDLIIEDMSNTPSFMSENVVDWEYSIKRFPEWVNTLGVSICKLFDCESSFEFSKDFIGKVTIKCYGYKTDVKLLKWTSNYIFSNIIRAANEYWIDHQNIYKEYSLTQRGVKLEFYEGASYSIIQKISKIIHERDKERKSSSNSLVVVKKERISEIFNKVFLK